MMMGGLGRLVFVRTGHAVHVVHATRHGGTVDARRVRLHRAWCNIYARQADKRCTREFFWQGERLERHQPHKARQRYHDQRPYKQRANNGVATGHRADQKLFNNQV